MNRTRAVVLILSASFVSMAPGEQLTCKVHTWWAEFHEQNMQRRNPCETVLDVDNVGKLALKWSYTIGKHVYSSPAVANGVVYVGSGNHNVYALDAETGTRLWQYTTGSHVYSSPAVANGVVYVGSSDHNVYAFDAKT